MPQGANAKSTWTIQREEKKKGERQGRKEEVLQSEKKLRQYNQMDEHQESSEEKKLVGRNKDMQEIKQLLGYKEI